MRTITKIFAVASAVAIFATSNLQAQTTSTPMMTTNGMAFKVGVGVQGGLFPDKSEMDYGYGADLKLQYDLSKDVAVYASGGYTKLKWKGSPLNFEFIPVMGGVKAFVIDRMYVTGGAGTGLALKEGAEMNFIYTGGLGYEWTNGLEIGAKYEGYVNNSASDLYFMKTGQFALRLGYNFKL
ncbi:hypothetical protein [Pedobacter jejuensis]|uniref:Outer membrane protein beta-barrel domain-containing protein n=1 Tax=Pedobacter jejuensis TaxID=1268550 RepID=A0A3N0BT39_9SPHI|nr:hypothetical protein [Pedobacter jejuensis]RNL52243.1 hypothetical protein D7004_11775 [Pedobacter jejuensis]